MTHTSEDPDPAVVRAEWRLRTLEELAEMCINVARTLGRETVASARLSREIQLTLALKAQTEESLRALRAEAESKREAGRIEATAGVVRSGAAHRMQ